jgi:hypothetical protein
VVNKINHIFVLFESKISLCQFSGRIEVVTFEVKKVDGKFDILGSLADAASESPRRLSRFVLKPINSIMMPRLKRSGAHGGKICNDKQRNDVFIAAVG